MAFKRDLQFGKQGEKEVIQVFRRNGFELVNNTASKKLKDYDLIGKVGKKNFTLEIKYDWLSERTGNLAIEYHNSSKDEPSGIDATKADIWIQIINDKDYKTVWAINVLKLRQYIKANKPLRVVTKAGDGNAELYLYKDFDILKEFTRLDNIDKDQFNKEIKGLLKS